MPACAAAGRSVTNLPTTLRGPNLYCPAGKGIWVKEVGVFNTTATGVAVALLLATTLGTQAEALTEVCVEDASYTPVGLAAASQTGNAAGTSIRQASLGAAIGSGVIWTFEKGLYRPAGTGNGIVLICPTGTAQHLDFYFAWEE